MEEPTVKQAADNQPSPANEETRKNVWNLGLVSLLNDTASEMIYPLMPSFLMAFFGAGPAVLGLIEGVAESTASLLKYLSGGLSDKLGKRKPIFLCGYLVSNLVRPLIGVTATWPQMLLARFGDRVGKGIRTSPRDALLADSISASERGWAFGVQRAMDHAGAVLGPLIASLLLFTGVSMRAVFLLSIIPGLFAIYWLWRKVVEIKPHDAGGKKVYLLKGGLDQFDVVFRRYLFVMLIFTLGNSTDAFLLMRAQNLGITLAMLPLLWAVFHVVKSAISIPGGWISDRINRKYTIILGWLVYAGVYFGFALARTAPTVWWLFIIYGAYYGLTEGTERAFVADLVPADKRGTAYGWYHLAVGFTALPASVLFGAIWRWLGVVPAFGMGAALATIAAFLLVFWVRKSA